MADSQRIDLSLLDNLRDGLEQLGREFESVGDIPGYYDVGAGDVQGALDDFGGKWKREREGMQASLTNAHGFVHTSVTEYDKLERQLTDALRPEGGGGR